MLSKQSKKKVDFNEEQTKIGSEKCCSFEKWDNERISNWIKEINLVSSLKLHLVKERDTLKDALKL